MQDSVATVTDIAREAESLGSNNEARTVPLKVSLLLIFSVSILSFIEMLFYNIILCAGDDRASGR